MTACESGIIGTSEISFIVCDSLPWLGRPSRSRTRGMAVPGFTLRNVGLDPSALTIRRQPYKILLLANSTQNAERLLDMKRQHEVLDRAFSEEQTLTVQVETLEMHTLPLARQLQIAADASVIVTGCGGAAFITIHLSPGATAILVCAGGRQLDLDKNAGYYHIH